MESNELGTAKGACDYVGPPEWNGARRWLRKRQLFLEGEIRDSFGVLEHIATDGLAGFF